MTDRERIEALEGALYTIIGHVALRDPEGPLGYLVREGFVEGTPEEALAEVKRIAIEAVARVNGWGPPGPPLDASWRQIEEGRDAPPG